MKQQFPTPEKSVTGRIAWPIAVSVAAAALLLVLAQSLPASIRGSAHDFSGLDANQQICIFCHTAHNADTTVRDAPLWNHTVTRKTYQVYNSATMQATVGQPSGASKLCLSCHDGTVAVDSYGGRTGSIRMGLPTAVGADELTNDPPISFVYDDALAQRDGALFPPSSHPSGLGNTISRDMLIDNKLECSSCHDVHNEAQAASVNDHLLVVTQVQSQLCLTCHNK
jgi:hypothetical protein